METLKYALIRQWGFILLAMLSVIISLVPKLPVWWLVPVSIIIILVNEAMNARRSRHERTLQIALRLKEVAEDFRVRFISTSSAYCILYLIRELGSTVAEKQETLKAWANGCNTGQDFLEYWLRYFIESLNLVIQGGAGREKEFSERCEEFMHMIRSYHKLVEAFYERVEAGHIPQNLEKYYNDFVTEYNAFIQNLRNAMDEAGKVLHLSIDPKNIGFAKELHIARWG